MKIDCISDLHGHYPKLEGGDLLIVAGDLTARDTAIEYLDFNGWLCEQKYDRKIVIAGNHDGLIEKGINVEIKEGLSSVVVPILADRAIYLQDFGCHYQGMKIWGSPWTKNFKGQNPKCKAFGLDTEEELAAKWALIPDDTNILITHSPPYVILDHVEKYCYGNSRDYDILPCGSETLRQHVMQRIKPAIHVFGHIHEWGGKIVDTVTTKFINASHVNEHYQPVNKPVRIIL